MVEQTAAIFYIGLVFAAGLIIAVKKDKSWAMVYWNAKDVAQLLDPLIRHHKASLIGCNCREEVLRLINKYRGPVITAFFRACHESQKTLRQLGQFARDSFSYADARLLVNSRIVKKILSCQSIPQTAFKTQTSDGHELKAINSPPVTFAWLTLANLHYGPFGDLVEGPLPTDVRGYTSPCHYSQYGQLLRGPSPAAIDGAGYGIGGDAEATCTKNRTNAGSGLGGDTENDGSAVVSVGS